MGLKYFTNQHEGNADISIAINSDHVVSVYASELDVSKQKKKKVTSIYCLNGTTFNVTEPYLEVVARLNERD
jgi:hypothetical protein